MDRRVQATLLYAEHHFHHRLPIGDLAHVANLSYWHFCRLFRAEKGTSPAQYLKALRLQRARQLLDQTFMSVKQVAHSIGMDESHFVRDFRTVYGHSPSRYRSAGACLRLNLVSRNSRMAMGTSSNSTNGQPIAQNGTSLVTSGPKCATLPTGNPELLCPKKQRNGGAT